MAEHIGQMDIVITTAQVPGRRPPVLVTAEAVKRMKPGSVIVDMAASDLGGNVELSKPDELVVTDNGVQIHAPTNIPATMAAGSSIFYARNISALLLHLVKDGKLALDPDDEITKGTLVSHGGKVVHEAVTKALGGEGAPAAKEPKARATRGQASTAGAATASSPAPTKAS
jgi:NAD(P) transhydrogenase subunit alpha